jgi:hypothetical protein
MKSFPALLGTVAILFFVLASAGCAELPDSEDSEGFFGPSGEAIETTPTPAYLMPVKPMETTTPTPQPTFPDRPTAEQTTVTYFEIYNETLAFNYNTVAFVYSLTKPPMNIDLTIHPDMVTDVKSGQSSYGDKDDYTVTKIVPNPQAEFSLRVIDLKDGSIVAEEGYGRVYSYTEDQLIRLYSPGTFQIEMKGNFVDVDAIIMVPEDNIP